MMQREKKNEIHYWVEAHLTGYDKKFTFSYPEEKLEDVYFGLLKGVDVVLLVEESDAALFIWEGQSNGRVFLSYETKAEWEKSNKRWALYGGLGFLAGGSFVVWVGVKGLRGELDL